MLTLNGFYEESVNDGLRGGDAEGRSECFSQELHVPRTSHLHILGAQPMGVVGLTSFSL